MKQKNSYNYQDLIDCGNGILFGEGNAKLPLPQCLCLTELQKLKIVQELSSEAIWKQN